VFFLNPGPCSVHTSYLKVFESDVASMQGSRLHCVQADDSCRSPFFFFLTNSSFIELAAIQLPGMRPGRFGVGALT
jgi:hypothetical protein